VEYESPKTDTFFVCADATTVVAIISMRINNFFINNN